MDGKNKVLSSEVSFLLPLRHAVLVRNEADVTWYLVPESVFSQIQNFKPQCVNESGQKIFDRSKFLDVSRSLLVDESGAPRPNIKAYSTFEFVQEHIDLNATRIITLGAEKSVYKSNQTHYERKAA